MSAADSGMTVDRQADLRGSRVKLAMTGNFLLFKCYGAAGNQQA